MKEYRLRIGQTVGVFYSASRLCEELNISRVYLNKLEERGILPHANFRYKKGNWGREGNRIYSKELVADLQKLFAVVKPGIKITDETKRLIAVAFQTEKQRFNNTNNNG